MEEILFYANLTLLNSKCGSNLHAMLISFSAVSIWFIFRLYEKKKYEKLINNTVLL